jgi:hypothetical protein
MKNNLGNYRRNNIITLEFGWAFISYNTPVIISDNGMIFEVDQKFSATTSKQITMFKREQGIKNTTKLSPEHFAFYVKKNKLPLGLIGAIYGLNK